MADPAEKKEPETSFRGLYQNVKISVKTLDLVILGGIALMVVLILFGIANKGFTVTFDSRGGTDIAQQTDLMYGDLLQDPEAPTREGYVFTGWYLDKTCQYPWDMAVDQVQQSMTLYAGWEAKTE